MEKLKAFIDKNSPSQAAFAAQVGILRPTLSRILAGTRNPSFDLVCDIERVTKGKVRIEHWQEFARLSNVLRARRR